MPNSLNIKTESWPLAGEFRISRGVRKVSDVIVIEIIDGNYIGRGECFPYGRYGENLISVMEQVKSIVRFGTLRQKELAQGLGI
jgi:L-alanine-DL-glutamate epimerase-like enolase superfamily enzyme